MRQQNQHHQQAGVRGGEERADKTSNHQKWRIDVKRSIYNL